jgi:RNA polymerase sigma-70 factor (ECF subfamily)
MQTSRLLARYVPPSRNMTLASRGVLWESPPGRESDGQPGHAMAKDGDVTALLNLASAGDPDAETRLFNLLYEELHRQARACMRRQPRGHTLQATALLNEAYFRIARHRHVRWESRGHFLSVAARAMRCVLVDHARTKGRTKRGDGRRRVPLDSDLIGQDAAPSILDLDDAIRRLAEHDARAARVVELMFFGGLTAAETARVLDVGLRTVERDWEYARAWLRRELAD